MQNRIPSKMSIDRHQRLKELFQRAEELSPTERQAFLAQACPEDPELRAEIEELLIEAGRPADSVLEPAPRAEASETTLEPGRILLHYRVDSSLGKGGMGEVHRALDTKLDREVALKVLPSEFASDPELLRRFKREAKALAALDHPGIVAIHSVEESEGIHFLTMGLVKGRTLAELIPDKGMQLSDLCDIAVPLTEAVGSAHRKGITHRDLKPGNVMVTNEGGVKVLDFGLAKHTFAREDGGQELSTEDLTVAGRIVGTVPYMSPEQAEGKPVDPRSDVFSLGILLYEMTTGQRPFRGDNALGILSQILQARPRPVGEHRPDAPLSLIRIIERCLERKPAARYWDASELHGDLLGLRGSLSPPTSDATVGSSVSGGSSRVGRLWLAAVVIVVLAAAGTWFFRSSREPRSEEVAAQAEIAKSDERPMVAVLPFQNLGSSQDEYFAMGMTEEIANRMSSVRSMGVIGTSSTRQYANTKKTAQEIGLELGAGYLVTGSVLWARSEDGSSRIRVTPQLVSTIDGTQIWAQSYDRDLGDIFAIHTEIASQVVKGLGISLADTEKAAVEQFPTDNLEAYDAYLRALAVPSAFLDPSSMQLRIEKLNRAVELDPGFARAWLLLTNSHSWFVTTRNDASEERRRMALEAAKMVEEIAPDSAIAAAAMGLYLYRVGRNYDRAVEELALAIKLNPNSFDAHWMHGAALRRRADWEAAAESYKTAMALFPRSAGVLRNLGITYWYLRRYEIAIATFDRAIELAEDAPSTHDNKVEALWSWAEDPASARRAVEAFPTHLRPVMGDYLWYWQSVYEGDFRAAADRMQTTRGEWLGMQTYLRPQELLEGLARLWLGERDLADQQFEAAVAKLEARLIDAPDSEKVLSSLGVALAALGRRDEAIEAALRATEIVPLATDPWFAQTHIEDLAWVYTLLGDYDSALEQLEILLERPSRLTIAFLKLDPRWTSLWDQPRFKALEKKFG